MILGIDVSVHQGNVPWQACYDEGVRYAFIKATEGQGYTDPMFLQHYEGAKKAGILVGAYHYFRPGRDPLQQSKHFKSVCDGLEIDLPPALDIETMEGLPPVQMIRATYKLVSETERLWGKMSIFYSYLYFLTQLKTTDLHDGATLRSMGERDLWLAQYTSRPEPTVPPPWTAWKFWQFDGDKGRRLPNGVDADYNWFNGSMDDLLDYCGKRRPLRTLGVEVPVEVPQAQDWVLGLSVKKESC